MTASARRLVPILVLGSLAGSAHASAPDEPRWTWADVTSSPSPLARETLTDREADLQAACGIGDAGLHAVAERLVARKLRGLSHLDLDGLSLAQRASGEPHVWPRAWVVSARALDHATTRARLDSWRRSFGDVGERRCGVAAGYAPDGTEVVAAVAVDALADLGALPIRARTGMWLTVDATMLVPTAGAHVVVLGPSGQPHSLPTWMTGNHVRARFAPDRPGPFIVQVVADVSGGPRPVLEAQLFADVEPPATTPTFAAPGEEAGVGAQDERGALTAMVQAVRAGEQLPPIVRDARLDALAADHARLMRRAHQVGHDLGDGDPAARLVNAGLIAREAGENVAHAPSVALAHRALYASPSHRTNLLRAEFDRMGVAVVDDEDGSVWVAEVFASGLR